MYGVLRINRIKVMATFDPGRLLAEPEKKRDVWDDMQKVMAVLGI